MTKFWSGVIAASFVATVGVSAQNNPPSPASPGGQAPKPAPSSQSRASDDKEVTIAGCIQSAPGASATAGAGGASASASSSKFVLANAKASGSSSGGAVGTTGSAARYQLTGDEKTISTHLNHQVEITGTLESASSSGASSSAAGGAAKGGATQMPTLKVESVKMVSATCS